MIYYVGSVFIVIIHDTSKCAVFMYIDAYIHIYIYVYKYSTIYTYIEREREREIQASRPKINKKLSETNKIML